MQKHPLGVDVADLQPQSFTQTQATRVDGNQTNTMVQGGHTVKDLADLIGRENDREFELSIGPDQFNFLGPGTVEGFLPKEFDGAEGLGGSLAGNFLLSFEIDEVLPEFLGRDQVR